MHFTRARVAAAVAALLFFCAPSVHATVAIDKSNCRTFDLDFIFNKDDPVESAIEGDIVSDLKNVGITVKSRALTKDDLNSNMTAGNFHLAFTESQGPPYDPQAFANSWGKADEAYHAALEGLQAPNDKATIIQSIKDVQLIVDETKREEKWTDILSALHRQATELPISGKRIPAVFNKRLTGYVPGLQQYDYPAHTIQVLSGSRTVTVAPGGQGGLFSSVTGVGRLDAHTYRPNEFWANNWVYEGLVEYGPGGTILPSLAESWTISDKANGGQTYTFTLRQNVKFHDGADWNCAAAKLNFDHVLALTHPWYGMPGQIDEWSCTGETFVVTTKAKYYPLLQELTFIRPLRMQSPYRFASGASTNKFSENSCVSGNVFGDDDDYADTVVTCAGIQGGGVSNGGNVSGTGRWIYTKTVKTGDSIDQVHFARNENHWDPPTGNTFVKELIVVHYATHEAVKAALLDGTLDAVMGSGPLKVTDIADLKKNNRATLSVLLTEPIQNRIVVMNTAKGPTKDLQTRKVIIHAVNKPSIIKNDLAGLESPAEALFPKDAPYCGADLTPRPEYDFEKARLLNCPAPEEKNQLQAPIIAIIVVLAFAAVAFGTVLVVMYRREKTGEPIFQPLVKPQETGKDMDIA